MIVGLLNLEEGGRLLAQVDDRDLRLLHQQLIDTLHSEHPRLMENLETSMGSCSAGEDGEAAVERVQQIVRELILSSPKTQARFR